MPESLEEKRAATDEHTDAYHGLADHPAKPEAQDIAVTGPVPYSNLTQQPGQPIPFRELAFGFCIFCLWIGFFGAGIFVPTATLRGRLWSGATDGIGDALGCGLVVVCCYTLTNILFLSCFAALLGCMMCRWLVRDERRGLADPQKATAAARPPYSPERIYLSAFLRGFFLYLLVLSGLMVVSAEPALVDTRFSQYIRTAGFVSVLSFAAGYDPNLIYKLIGRVTDLANQPLSGKKRPGEPVAKPPSK